MDQQAVNETNRDAQAIDHRSRAIWFVGPLSLLAEVAGVFFVMSGPSWVLGGTLAVLFGLTYLWIFVCVFSSANADRKCPQCGEYALEQLDPATTLGLVCSRCSFRDETASSFFLAEEEGQIEAMILSERQAKCEALRSPLARVRIARSG